ncbi:MAG: hypothetical protein AMXMBFR57_36180 [Acidimicrobiia bacterium]
MLQELLQYARRKELVTEPGFAPKEVRWAVVFDRHGKFLQVLSLAPEGQRKGRGRVFGRAPDLTQPEMKRGGAGCRHFLIDSADVVALHEAGPDQAKALAKHEYFVSLLQQASAADPTLAPIAAGLREEAVLSSIREAFEENKVKASDKVTVATMSPVLDFPVDRDAWHDWWRAFRASLARTHDGDTRAEMRCVATGEMVKPAATHPKVSGLADVGGIAMGDSLVSFKQEAFSSYGLAQSANAAMSEAAAVAYRAALNDIVSKSYRLGHSRVAYWFKDAVRAADDPFAFLTDLPGSLVEGDALNSARVLLDSVRSGTRSADLGKNRFHMLTMSGASGRIMVRDWSTGAFGDLAQSVAEWFEDLSVIEQDGSGRLARAPKFFAVCAGLVRDVDTLSPAVEVQLWRAATQTPVRQIPDAAMALALLRFKVDLLKGERFNHARVGLMKAYHRRKGDKKMAPGLVEDHPSAAYQCGRLMAVYSRIQQASDRDRARKGEGINVGVVERFYAAASVTPALVLGRLDALSRHHRSKLRSTGKEGLAVWFGDRLTSIWARIDRNVPSTLTLAEQSLFALGFYQELATRATTSSAHEADDNSEGATE